MNQLDSTLVSPLAHELNAGDIVLIKDTPHTILSVTNVGVDDYSLWNVTCADGKAYLVDQTRQFARIYPLGTTEPSSAS